MALGFRFPLLDCCNPLFGTVNDVCVQIDTSNARAKVLVSLVKRFLDAPLLNLMAKNLNATNGSGEMVMILTMVSLVLIFSHPTEMGHLLKW